MGPKNKLVLVGLGSALLWAGAALATPAGTVDSDYSKGVSEGQAQIKSDPAAATSQNEVKEGEIVEGDVDNGNVEVQEKVEAGESTQSAESGDKSDSSSSSESSSKSADSGSSSDSSSNGGDKQ